MKKYLILSLALFTPHFVSAHTGDDMHNALGMFGHPAAVVLMLIALVGVRMIVRSSKKEEKKKTEDVSK